MTEQGTVEAVRAEITVCAPLERAFEVFTKGFDTWWPRTHHIGDADMQTAVLEEQEGGRWYERGVDGSECDWGRVLAWNPPRRFVVSWQLDPDYKYDPDPTHASEVEVRFVPDGPGLTRVELEHRNLDRHGAQAEKMRGAVGSDGGWPGLLKMFAEAATRD